MDLPLSHGNACPKVFRFGTYHLPLIPVYTHPPKCQSYLSANRAGTCARERPGTRCPHWRHPLSYGSWPAQPECTRTVILVVAALILACVPVLPVRACPSTPGTPGAGTPSTPFRAPRVLLGARSQYVPAHNPPYTTQLWAKSHVSLEVVGHLGAGT